MQTKLHAWHSGPSSSVTYGSASWHLSQHLLSDLKRWEFRWLREALGLRRRQDEGQKQYNERTSRTICSWSARINAKLAHQRVLLNVFRDALLENRNDHPGGNNHVANHRNCRSRLWWEFERSMPGRSKAAGSNMRAKPGPLVEWEDVFVKVFGVDWRSLCDSMATSAEWRLKEEFFVNTFCALWHLPPLGEHGCGDVGVCAVPRPKHQRLSSLDDRPQQHSIDGVDTCAPWERTRGRFLFVVDCKPVQQVSCGTSPLRALDLHGSFDAMSHDLQAILVSGWLPARSWDDPVMWKQRGQNTISYFLANYTMDNQRSWLETFEWPYDDHALDNCNVIAHSDGGTRRDRCSASAWIVESCVLREGKWIREPLAMGGTHYDNPISSFSAEALALQACILFVRRLLDKGSSMRPLRRILMNPDV